MGRKPEEAIRDIIVILFLSITAGFLAWHFHPRKPDIDIILTETDPLSLTYAQVMAYQQDRVLWVDARTRSQYQRGHIPGAVLLNEDEWDVLFGELLENHYDPAKVLVVYCDAQLCDASRSVTKRLREYLPELTVYYLHGGLVTWRENQ